MAYVTFEPSNDAIAPVALGPLRRGLSAIERRVVILSLRDPRASLRPSSSMRELMARVFGMRRANGLADHRLEMLRRYAVAYRLALGDVGDRYRDDALSAGMSADAIAETHRMVDDHVMRHARHRTSPLQLLALTGAILILIRLHAAIARGIGDPWIALILVALALVVVASMTLPTGRAR